MVSLLRSYYWHFSSCLPVLYILYITSFTTLFCLCNSCKNDTDDVFYNELHFYDKVQIHVSIQFLVFENQCCVTNLISCLQHRHGKCVAFFFHLVITFKDSRERVYDRTINFLIRKQTPDYAWPRLQKDPAKVRM